MGLRDFINKFTGRNDELTDIPVVQQALPYEIEYGKANDGRLLIDFFDHNPKVAQMYNSTRLVINENPIQLADSMVYNCLISWYGRDDCMMLDSNMGRETSRRGDYKGILADLDLNALKTNPEYCANVMKMLLPEQRIRNMLEMGLTENPERPCGKYIGGIKNTEEGYRKFFSLDAGLASHNSPYMQQKRANYQEENRAKRETQIAEKQAKIEQLKKEINGLGEEL